MMINKCMLVTITGKTHTHTDTHSQSLQQMFTLNERAKAESSGMILERLFKIK